MSIFVSIKRLLKHSAVYGIGHIINRVIGFLLLPLYTNLFPPDKFGVAGLMFTYFAILSIFYTYGLDAAFFRFFIGQENPAERKRIFSTAFFTLSLTSILFSGVLFFAAEPISQRLFSPESAQLGIDLPGLVRIAAGVLLFDSLAFLPFLILRAEEKSVPFVAYKFLNIAINVVFNILLLIVLKYGVEGIFLADLVAAFATFLLVLPIILKHVSIGFSKSTLRELFAFGLPYLPTTLSVVLMDTIDRVFLERLSGVEAVGLYNAGAKLGMFMALFITAFRFAWHPFFLSTAKQANAKDIFAKILTYVLLACSVVFLALSLFIDNIARLQVAGYSLIGKQFWNSTVVVPAIMLAYILYAAYLNFLIGVYLEKKTKYLALITITGMLGNLLANYLLIPVIGLMGAAWARSIAYLIMAVALYAVHQRLYYIRYEWGRIAKLSLAVAAIFALGQLSVAQSHVLLKLTLLLAFPVLLLTIGFFERAELTQVRRVFSSFAPRAVKSR